MAIQAHNAKLNSAMFSKNDVHLLTSGRDNAIRLWDVRSLGVHNRDLSRTKPTKAIVAEYNKHQCVGYNITAQFYNDEKNIITGSEDKQVYIYDTLSANITRAISFPPPNHVIHLVAPQPNTLDFVSSSIEDTDILLWSPTRVPYRYKEKVALEDFHHQDTPIITIPRIAPQPQPQSQFNINLNPDGVDLTATEQDMMYVEQEILTTHRTAVESLMRKYGDKILQLFHRYNVTFSSLDWNNILSSIGNESDASDLIQMVNEMALDFQRAYEYCSTEGNTAEGLEAHLASFHIDPPPTAIPTTVVSPTTSQHNELPTTTTTTTTTTMTGRRGNEIGAFVETASPTFLPLCNATNVHGRLRGIGNLTLDNSRKVRRNPENSMNNDDK